MTTSVRNNSLEYLKWMEKIKSIHYTDNDAMSRAIESFKPEKNVNRTPESNIKPVIINFTKK